MKQFILIIFAVCVIGLVVAGSTYYLQKKNFDLQYTDINNRVAGLLEDNANLNVKVKELTETQKTELKIIPDLGNAFKTTDLSKNWLTYKNEKLGIEIKYPPTWQVKEPSAEEIANGQIIFLSNPQPDNKDKHLPPDLYNTGVIINYWTDINSPEARSGQWMGERKYTSLEDHFTDNMAMKQPFSRFDLNDNRAYEVWVGGMDVTLAIMLEKKGIYELYFPGINELAKITNITKEIIASFKVK